MKKKWATSVIRCLTCGIFAAAIISTGFRSVGEAGCPGIPGVPCGNGDVNGDGSVDLADAIYLLQNLFAGGPEILPLLCEEPPSSCSPPATGQTQCFDLQGNQIPCVDGSGQDGFHQSGCPLSECYQDSSDGTITDTCTGLMWQQATAPGAREWQQALSYCEDLELAGYDDWRLPSVKELQSIQDWGRQIPPSINPVFSCEVGAYWASTSWTLDPRDAVTVHFGNFAGLTNGVAKTGITRFVRAVRDVANLCNQHDRRQ